MKTRIAGGKVEVVRDDKGGASQWTCSNPEQAEKMLPTWSGLPRGDKSAIQDAANDYRKQRDS